MQSAAEISELAGLDVQCDVWMLCAVGSVRKDVQTIRKRAIKSKQKAVAHYEIK